ncbi:putative zinc protease [Alteripontixanthobacter maritimus]|uniref:Putative zinc protease n=1 Tax=Alteripontixanthobacter maritimus TaxID=2161824 RepID=A0A369QAH0_9SPHN|nr:pitrilysin family protein [Alteripontixanthobacter maritimus]RDC59278.1 putative zinc protease [Alteripontixanthobacter maritimus]
MRLKLALSASVAALSLAGCATVPADKTATSAAIADAAVADTAPVSQEPADLAALTAQVDLPHEKFVLDNGLTVVTHTDRKAPVVALSVWYDVGSKHEPKGKTGFAHLFEHLMFNGTENAPADFFEYLRQIGATGTNGTTNADRTNYFETVPTGALETGLMLESDRMGYLLGAVTQEVLDNQRGVVQNEKRQGDNQPYGLLRYEIFENLFPKGHPYHHSTIGSMDDLNAATMDDVQTWFRDHYGPNNAVLVLSGDIDAATARPLVEKWFGDIPRGPEVVDPEVTIPTLPADKEVVTTDQISTTRIYRMWTTPGETDPESVPLQLAGAVLGGLSSSRLDDELVRNDPVATSVSAFQFGLEDAGAFIIQADVKPGVDPAEVASKLDAQIADFIAKGPTEDELLRAKTVTIAGVIRGLESVGGFGGKAPVLAEGELYHGNPAHLTTVLAQSAATTPAAVTAAMRKWLTRPVFKLVMNPGERTEGGENRGGAIVDPIASGTLGMEFYCQPTSRECDELAMGTMLQQVDRSTVPEPKALTGLDFPDIERTTLSNGMDVYFARRDAIPAVTVRVTFDAGYTADPMDGLGTQSVLLSLMDEGTATKSSSELAIAQERLGASINGFADADWTSFQLSALSPNLAPSLDLLAEYIRQPALAPADLERVRAQQLNRLSSELKSPNSIASRALAPLVFGDHPYAIPSSGRGNKDVVEGLTRTDLLAFHNTWLRPDNAKVFVVGDTTLREVTALLERTFGDWQAPPQPLPTKNFDVAIPDPEPRVVLIDRPNSPQSVITAARVLNLKGTDDTVLARAANEAFGGNFLSRINMNLRETKGWSYGVRSSVSSGTDRLAMFISAPVQADRTADSLAELRKDLTEFTTTKGVTAQELQGIVNSNVRELPGQFETSGGVLAGLVNIVKYGRDDTYYEDLADRYRAITAAELDQIARSEFVESDLVFVVVGDKDVVAPQLEALDLPLEIREAE